MKKIHIGGANSSGKSYRDVVHMTDLATPYPVSYDADFSKIPVGMQHQIGICTAEAVCSLIEHFRGDGVVLSRKFTYLVGKTLVDGNLIEGSSIKSMLHGAYKYGTQPVSVVPDNITEDTKYNDFINYQLETPIQQKDGTWKLFVNGVEATKIPGYVSVPVDYDSYALGMVKYKGLAVRYTCGATWYSDKNGITWDPKRIFPLLPPKPVISGHAMVARGYDFINKHKNTIRNSWSKLWGNNGDGWSYMDDYAPTEAWAILPATPVIVPKFIHQFNTDIGLGETSDEVIALQTALQLDGCFPKTQKITSYYGPVTQVAVRTFQAKYKVANPVILWFNNGRLVSTATRRQLNILYS